LQFQDLVAGHATRECLCANPESLLALSSLGFGASVMSFGNPTPERLNTKQIKNAPFGCKLAIQQPLFSARR